MIMLDMGWDLQLMKYTIVNSIVLLTTIGLNRNSKHTLRIIQMINRDYFSITFYSIYNLVILGYMGG